MERSTLFVTDEQRVDELTLTARQLAFLKRLRLLDQQVFVSRTLGKLLFHGPVIGKGPMPLEEPRP
jgi:hypothetical protein